MPRNKNRTTKRGKRGKCGQPRTDAQLAADNRKRKKDGLLKFRYKKMHKLRQLPENIADRWLDANDIGFQEVI